MRKGICLFLLTLLFGCSSKDGYQTIKSDNTLQQMQKGAVLIDVREPDEYAAGHIKDSINMPLQELDQITTSITDKETKIIVYCRSGNRSKTASKKLLAMGYHNIYDLGGINSWPYEIVK